ncbi:hypothetical protein [Thalassospira lucentensis]|uniref:hypothetical protein n=1 Tax=Thalassospira lucentensis TaxID=168935 RepID=UPI0003B64034|nr:hypothetical protein [Thalassospira lucentensis]RCK28936.1 hypothetical protein TH1_07400 [Thalassospira lucentensis MCCC 1A00383 = DSM 14000]
MNVMANTTGDVMANWKINGGVLLAQNVNAAEDIDQEMSAAASTQGASCDWIDPELNAAAATNSRTHCW